MSQALTARNFVNASSRAKRTARTLLLRVAADEARAERIRQLKQDHPEHTWQAIADYVGVSLRAAQAWQESGGISYPNAKKLAELWAEDVLYIMNGRDHDTPDLFVVRGEKDRLDLILGELADAKLDRAAALESLEHAEEERVRMQQLIDTQNGLLKQQADLLAKMDARLTALEAVDRALEALEARGGEARRAPRTRYGNGEG